MDSEEKVIENTKGCKHFDRPNYFRLDKFELKGSCREECEEKDDTFVCCFCNREMCMKHFLEHHQKESNTFHFLGCNTKTLKFYCFDCKSYVNDDIIAKKLPFFESEMHFLKYNKHKLGYKLDYYPSSKSKNKEQNSPNENEKNIIDSIFKTLAKCPSLKESVDSISRRSGMVLLQKVLKDTFGRKTFKYDEHGVFNFSLEKTVKDLDNKEEIIFENKFGQFKTTGSHLKKEAESFKLYYIPEFVAKKEIKSHFVDKVNGRSWNSIFNKHFYITTSEIKVIYDNKGLPLPMDWTNPTDQMKKEKKIVLVGAVGFDVSANRLTCVHQGDFIRLMKRKDKENILKRGKRMKMNFFSKRINILNTELFQDSFEYWIPLDARPKTKYDLDEEKLLQDYKVMFALIFSALQKEGIEIPIGVGIGCGVFGNKFAPDYQRIVAQAYFDVLCEKDYGFKAFILSDVNIRNIAEYQKVFAKNPTKSLTPIIISQFDILLVARFLSAQHNVAILNAGDLWEFGQFWEGGGALEEYIARMTTSFFSQHYLLNPNVVDESKYIPLNVNDLGIKIDPKYVKELETFIQNLKTMFISNKGKNFRK